MINALIMDKIPLLKHKIVHIVYTLTYQNEMLWEAGVSIIISIGIRLRLGNLSVLHVCVWCRFFVFSSLLFSCPSPSIRPISFKQSIRVLEKPSYFYRKPGKQEQVVSDHLRQSRVMKFGALRQRSATRGPRNDFMQPKITIYNQHKNMKYHIVFIHKNWYLL